MWGWQEDIHFDIMVFNKCKCVKYVGSFLHKHIFTYITLFCDQFIVHFRKQISPLSHCRRQSIIGWCRDCLWRKVLCRLKENQCYSDSVILANAPRRFTNIKSIIWINMYTAYKPKQMCIIEHVVHFRAYICSCLNRILSKSFGLLPIIAHFVWLWKD